MKFSLVRLAWAGLLITLCCCTPSSERLETVPASPQTGQTGSQNTLVPTLTDAPILTHETVDPGWSTPSPTLIAAATFTPTALPSQIELCSPLEEIPLSELLQPDLLKNPFQAPRPGMDDGHHGIDFAYWSRGERKTMLGLPVQSVLEGRVAGLIQNRQPYGFAVIIETPLRDLDPAWLKTLNIPVPQPTLQPAPNLYCPPGVEFISEQDERSLYLLYAHFNDPPLVSLDQPVTCGQQIGEVGTTGKSVNPHLHLETRVGPAGVTFQEMAHYENAATEVEMQSYCAWRVSGLFQMFDPASLFQTQTLQP